MRPNFAGFDPLAAGAAFIAVATGILVAADLQSMAGWGSRLALAACAVLLWGRALSAGRRPFLLSPLLILGTTALLFYSVIPAAATAQAALLTIKPFHLDRAAAFLGRTAEALVLQFAAFALAGHALLATWAVVPSTRPDLPLPRMRAGLLLLIPVMVLGARFLPLAAMPYLLALLGGALPALLLLFRRPDGGVSRVAVVLAVVSLASAFSMGLGKIPAFIGLSLSLVMIVPARRAGGAVSTAALGLLLLAGVAVPATVMVNQNLFRNQGMTFEQELERLVVGGFRAKLVTRQVDTDFCLANVAARHLGREGGNPLFFLEGLVPRAVWPDKPSLSLGDHYATEYCGFEHEWVFGEGARGQSSSITLLGQPLIRTGLPGLAIAQAILIAVLGGVTWWAARRGVWGSALLAALLPWLVDFDQDFGIYVANAVKYSLLALLPVLLVLPGAHAR